MNLSFKTEFPITSHASETYLNNSSNLLKQRIILPSNIPSPIAQMSKKVFP